MKRFAALFFLLLISLTSLSGQLHACDTGYEWFADHDESETESKEEKKESKEFTSHAYKKFAGRSLLHSSYNACRSFVLPNPTLENLTPPPDHAF